MGWSVEVESPVSAVRLYRALQLDWHNLAPKVIPQVFTAGQVLEGDGGVGSVRQINFTPSGRPYGFIQERLDFADHDNFEAENSLVGGGSLGTKLEGATMHFKFVPKDDGGCICKVVMTSKPLPGVEPTDEEVKMKEGQAMIIKAVEAYLLANPTAYA